MKFEQILAVYDGSDGEATKALYARLLEFAPRGLVAVRLLQASKASARAKAYRGKWVRVAYDKKDWAISELCRALVAEPDVVPSWGWARDPKAIGFEDVLYVDIPGAGQVSFHTSYRKDGPDYAGAWDGVRNVASRRICRWAEAVFDGREVFNREGGDHDGLSTGTEGATAEGATRTEAVVEEQKALDL